MTKRLGRIVQVVLFAAGCLLLLGAPGETPAPDRPAALVPLYISFAGLNALDIDSTYRALSNGGREANPVAAQMVASPAALIALKAGTAAGAIALTERLRKRSPKAAVLLMVAFNSAMATIVAHNYSVAAPHGR